MQQISDIISSNKKVHICGIYGIGMSAIAQYLYGIAEVQGSDASFNAVIHQTLNDLGIRIFTGGNNANNITSNVGMLVYSTAVKANNVEIIAAKKLGIPLFSRAEVLAYITKQHDTTISITGAHGKTTTTTMIGNFLYDVGYDPTIISGGIMGFNNNNFHRGCNDELIVVEADESDGTFCAIKTDIAIITNIEFEHVEYYKDFDALLRSCVKFATGETVKTLIVCGDDMGVRKMLDQINTSHLVLKYGFDKSNDAYPQNIVKTHYGTSFDIVIQNNYLVKNIALLHLFECWDNIMITHIDNNSVLVKNIMLKAHGIHNILNGMSAFLAVLFYVSERNDFHAKLKCTFMSSISDAMKNFQGVARRFNILSQREITIIDDYAHHPSEVRATVTTATEVFYDKRIIAILQPHRYTRLQMFMHEFSTSLDQVDVVIITDVYSAGEEPIDNVTGKQLYEVINDRISHSEASLLQNNINLCYFAADKESLFTLLRNVIKKDDVLLFMGAGNITTWAHKFSIINQ